MCRKNRLLRNKMWESNPYCENCGVLTILPKDVPGEINPNNGHKNIKSSTGQYGHCSQQVFTSA